MNKKRITRILAKADRQIVSAMSASIQEKYRPVILKEPGKT
jgi:hypothetical protein